MPYVQQLLFGLVLTILALLGCSLAWSADTAYRFNTLPGWSETMTVSTDTDHAVLVGAWTPCTWRMDVLGQWTFQGCTN